MIDVVWLTGVNHVAAAFEVEHTTSVYSGLLRMADLAALSPNLSFPLYVVAPASRLQRVRRELVRPTFRALELDRRCRFFSSEALLKALPNLARWATGPDASEKLAEMVTTDGRRAWRRPLQSLGHPAGRQSFDEQHAGRRRRVAELLGIRVLGRGPPGAGLVGVLELEDHEAGRAPVTLEALGLAAAGDVAAAVLVNGWRREILVVGVALGVVDVDFDDDVGGHELPEW